ncbi:MAG TPA: methyltransferase domain-containing protein [bacterium]
MPVHHVHDIENDLEHTIPPEGGPDSDYLFRVMTARALALLEVAPGDVVVDLGSGMGQDTLAIASSAPGVVALGVEPSNRMIRFGQGLASGRFHTHAHMRDALASHAHSAPTHFLRSFGEELAIKTGTVDALLCKGALDHFVDPRLTLAEITRVLRPGGRAVIALANYDSLACRLGRAWDRMRRWWNPAAEIPAHPMYEPPPDHLTRYGYDSIVALPTEGLRLKWMEGLSLLWGFGPWARTVAALPSPLAQALVRAAAVIAKLHPRWADVIVIQMVRRP